MLTINNKNIISMNYQDLINLGFQRTDYEDAVFFKQYGQQPFYLELKVSKRIEFLCNSEDMIVKLVRTDKQDNIVGTIVFSNMQELKDMIEFFFNKETALGRLKNSYSNMA